MLRMLICLMIVSLVAGCADEQKSASDAPLDLSMKMTPPAPPPPPPSEPKAPEPPWPRGGGMELSSNPLTPDVNDTLRVKAAVGAGKKGRRLDDERLVQMIVTPARAFFRTQERLVFEIQIPQALNLYQATNGNKPKTHDEFMEQIIGANSIRLPELPAGQRYVYDVESGELMIEKPAR